MKNVAKYFSFFYRHRQIIDSVDFKNTFITNRLLRTKMTKMNQI